MTGSSAQRLQARRPHRLEARGVLPCLAPFAQEPVCAARYAVRFLDQLLRGWRPGTASKSAKLQRSARAAVCSHSTKDVAARICLSQNSTPPHIARAINDKL